MSQLESLVFQSLWETRKHPIEENIEKIIYDVHWQESEGINPPDRALVLKIIAMHIEIVDKYPQKVNALKGQAWVESSISFCLKNGVNSTIQEVITEKYKEIVEESQEEKSQ